MVTRQRELWGYYMKEINFDAWLLEDYVKLMESGEHFTVSKFGDGELQCMFKSLGLHEIHGQNADGHKYFNDLGLAIHNSFVNEKGYFKLCSPEWFSPSRPNTYDFLVRYFNEYEIDTEKIKLHVCNDEFSLYYDAMNGRLRILTDQFEKMNFVWVSNIKKKQLNIRYVDFIEVPEKNSWLEKDNIIEQMINVSEKYQDVIFGVSMGLPSLAIQDEVYGFIKNKSTMFNVGSIFDPYVGVFSRGYHRKYKIREF
jgi:hypothetical protein